MKKLWFGMMLAVLGATVISFGAARWLSLRSSVPASVPTLYDIDWLQRELNLSGDQRRQLSAAATGFSDRFDVFCAAHCEARIELGQELAKPAPDIERCRRSVEAMNRAQADAERVTLEHILNVRSVLTKQQAERYGRLVCDQVCSMLPPDDR